MINIKYFLQFIIIVFLFLIFKILVVRFSSFLSGKLFQTIGPAFRSKEIINNNIKRAFPDLNSKEINKIKSSMWNNYGRVFAEYIYMKNFRHGNLSILPVIDKDNKYLGCIHERILLQKICEILKKPKFNCHNNYDNS